ncbi:MAG TPA: SiaB family protein kinase [Chloroflexota bacterium]|nr:SiaB family protein kinase [Chloroflexota bacterium]
MINLQNLRARLEEYQVIICFSGHFSQGITEQISEAIRAQLKGADAATGDTTTVISVFVEQAQNIINYNALNRNHPHYDQLRESGMSTIGKTQDGFFVTSGNLVDNRDLEELESRIDYLNSLNPAQLKQHYKDVMKSDSDPQGRGAGLGLIHMARKSRSALEYMHSKLTEELSYFQISVAI